MVEKVNLILLKIVNLGLLRLNELLMSFKKREKEKKLRIFEFLKSG